MCRIQAPTESFGALLDECPHPPRAFGNPPLTSGGGAARRAVTNQRKGQGQGCGSVLCVAPRSSIGPVAMVGWVLSALVVAALASIGPGGLVAPRIASAHYGIVLDDPRALGFIRAMAARDLAIGGLLGLMALDRARGTLGWGMCLAALIAVIELALGTAAQ